MKLSKPHIAILAAGLGSMLCMSAYAETAKSFPVVVPENQASFHLGVTGLYVTPTNDDLYFAATGDGRERNDNRCLHSVDLDYEWGWRLDAGYNFACSGNDISANWTHVSGDDDCSISGQGIRNRFVDESRFNRVKGDAEFDFDEVNLELGQKVDFCSLHTRFHFGLSYANFCHDFDTNGSGRGRYRRSSLTAHSHLESEFWGIGPRFGFDATYPIGGPCSPFSVVGHAAGALLAGETCFDSKGSVSKTLDGMYETTVEGWDSKSRTVVNTFNCNSDDEYTVIPAGTFKIGLKYSSNPDPACGGWGAEIGYQTTGYYHIVHHGADLAGSGTSTSNFGLYGYYLTLSYAG